MSKKNRNDKSTSMNGGAAGYKDYLDEQSQESKDYSSFKVVLFYCSLIVFLPVVTFFMLKSFVLESLFSLSEIKGNIYAATGAVIALHVALALYIYRAYFDTGHQMAYIPKKLN